MKKYKAYPLKIEITIIKRKEFQIKSAKGQKQSFFSHESRIQEKRIDEFIEKSWKDSDKKSDIIRNAYFSV